MTLEEDPIIDEEEEEEMKGMEMNFGEMNLDKLVERQQYQAERQNKGEYGKQNKQTNKQTNKCKTNKEKKKKNL